LLQRSTFATESPISGLLRWRRDGTADWSAAF
jgi:hypothetical protein